MVSAEEANLNYAASIGKTVAQLTDVEKKEAFRTEALAQAREAIGRLGETSAMAGDMFTRFTTSLSDLKDLFSVIITQSSLLKIFFFELGSIVGNLVDAIRADASFAKSAFSELGVIAGNAFLKAFVDVMTTPIIGDRSIFGDMLLGGLGERAEANMNAAIDRLADIARAAREAVGEAPVLEIRTFAADLVDVGDSIRNNLVSAVADLATEFKNVLDIVKNLAQTILRSLVTALGKAVGEGGSLGDVLKGAGTPGLIGAGIGLISQFIPGFHEGGVVRPQFAAAGSGNVPAMLQAGEVVLSRATVGRLGGPAAADQLNQGGASGSSATPTFVFDASRLPAASNPLAAARDGDWVAFLSDSIAAWEENGGSLSG